MPALPQRKKNRPFKPQKELKRKRTHKTLQRYAKRRAEYANTQTMVFLLFFIHYHKSLWQLWRDEVKEQNRSTSMIRSRKYRARRKLLQKKARLQVKLDAVAAKLKTAQEQVQLKEIHLRRHGTKPAGFLRGWAATEDMSPEEARTWAKRYVVGFNEARAERQRIDVLMSVQQSKSVVQPINIQL